MDIFQNLPELFRKYLDNKCTPDEVERVLNWLESDDNAAGKKALLQELLNARPASENLSDTRLQQVLDRNAARILSRIEENNATVIQMPRERRWLRVGVAVVILLAGISSFWWLTGIKNQDGILVSTEKTSAKKIIRPVGDKAVLTLADGTQIVLDETHNGAVAQQGNAKIIKIDGKLSYHKEGKSAQVVYNTITTPKGRQYQLILADGSKVWLNAMSSLRFPTAFTGKERDVELTGEGYFEIEKDPSHPFHVKANNMEVEVLGTHFNIMAYSDESAIKTTLLEGSVKIRSGINSSLLKPGQQARLNNENIKIKDGADIEEVVAWKNGYFQFERNAGIEEVMRQMSRWYNVEIKYAGAIAKRSFGGKISRESDLQEVLKVLELSKIHFDLDGRTLIVKP